MFTLLIPLLTLLAEVSNAEDVSDFKNPINVTFTVPDSGTTGPEWSWKDRTKYEPFDKKYDESGGFQNVSGDLVAYMLFARPNDKDTARLFDWTTDKGDPAMKSCRVWLEEEPKVTTLTYDLIGHTFGPTLEDTQFLKVHCVSAQQSMAVFANIPPTSTQGPTQSTTISSGVTPTVDTESLAASVEAAPKLKENLLITFVAKPDYLIDTTGEWWHDTTKYEDIHDHSAESISEDERQQLSEGNSDTLFKLGQIKYNGLSTEKRTYSWEPTAADGASPVVKECTLALNKDKDPGVPEVWIWAQSLTLEPRRDGKPLNEAETKKFWDDKIIDVHC